MSDQTGATPSTQAQAATATGVLIMVAAMAFIPIMDVFAKLLSTDHGAFQVGFGRFLGQAIVSFGVLLVIAPKGPYFPGQIAGHALRGTLLAFATVFFFAALKTMPIADALAVFFVEPLILTVLSALVLKEQVGARRWAAIGIGFIGTLLVIQPSWSVFGTTALLPVGTAFCFAFYLMLTRRLSGTGSVWSMHLVSGISGSVVLGIALIGVTLAGIDELSMKPVIGIHWAYYVGLSVVGAVSHMLIVVAFSKASAATLAPLGYLEMVSAVIYGYVIFNNFPNALTWVGTVILISSGIYIMHRERVRQSPAVPKRRVLRR